jgi:hypothetical protein
MRRTFEFSTTGIMNSRSLPKLLIIVAGESSHVEGARPQPPTDTKTGQRPHDMKTKQSLQLQASRVGASRPPSEIMAPRMASIWIGRRREPHVRPPLLRTVGSAPPSAAAPGAYRTPDPDRIRRRRRRRQPAGGLLGALCCYHCGIETGGVAFLSCLVRRESERAGRSGSAARVLSLDSAP